VIAWELLAELHGLESSSDPDEKRIGEEFYPRALGIFRKQNDGADVSFFHPVGGIYVLADGSMDCMFYGNAIKFDWTEARRLLFQVDALGAEAKEWWSDPPKKPCGRRPQWLDWIFVGIGGRRQADEERRQHSMRAYGIATMLLGAIDRENARDHETDDGGLAPPTAAFEKDMLTFQKELRDAEARFRRAAQRTAQSRYWQGTMVGALLIAGITAIGGITFWLTGTEAAYGVALPAGAIGAMVSVLQRMSTGKLKLDFEAGRDLLEVFAAVRPFIGAVFALAVMALLLGGFVPAVDVPADGKLAFFAALGFLAGFNELGRRTC
jgi:multisubunit Na+/H+ antiporter MnhB subunit